MSDAKGRFQGKSVVVTGAASGIGRATALAFARAGGRLYASDVDEVNLAKVAGEIRAAGTLARADKLDVSDRAAMKAYAEKVHAEVPALDVLVNNAGVAVGGGFLDTTLEDWDWILSINVMGVIHGCHFFAPAMAARGQGQIVNIASLAGLCATSALAAYSSTKFAVVGLSEALRDELAPKGVGVTAICPGIVDTAITKNMRGRGKLADPQVRENVQKMYLKRAYGADKAADVIVDAAARNRALVPVTPEAWGAYVMKRLSPALMSKLSRAFVARSERTLT